MMQELVKMMLLVEHTSGRNGRVQFRYITDSDRFDEAWEGCVAFVGEHNPVDGCSTKPRKYVDGETHGISRSTSFGTRAATITRVPWMRGA